MIRLVRDITFLVVITIFLAVITLNSVVNLRVLREETKELRLRNEAASVCQLKALQTPIELRGHIPEYIQGYKDCVTSLSGTPSPLGKKF